MRKINFEKSTVQPQTKGRKQIATGSRNLVLLYKQHKYCKLKGFGQITPDKRNEFQ